MASIGVIGSGTWGTALAVLLQAKGHQVTIWSALEKEVEALSKERIHPNLPGISISEEIQITGRLEEAMEEKRILVMSVPSVFVRATAAKMKPWCKRGQIIVNVAKGIEEKTLMTLSQIIEDELPQADVAVLSGPSHAEEVSRGLPTTCVTAAKSRETAELVQDIFMNQVFRVYTSPDILGVELGGSLKNVIALAAGIADGLGYGDNTKAALITRGIAEIARLGTAMGGEFQTFCGLTGIGDLIVTCASMHSRNRRAGILIGQGKTMEEAMEEVHMVVEGVYSAKAALALARKYHQSMPIVEQVNQVLFDGKSAREAVNDLMLRDKRTEGSGLLWEQFEKRNLENSEMQP
ncbi:MAG: NAD(P)H-dependent glycerol-3-phosphate dehydrogenase [Lachnospiraceae bacterium]|jgi:glycerol-3-phosphate dehydrogenase (NAD(P)+)|nr:NAD(P)H-dependent glycerol-3-phosphate dehydrogenase [Lachnospiraceae bacterium]